MAPVLALEIDDYNDTGKIGQWVNDWMKDFISADRIVNLIDFFRIYQWKALLCAMNYLKHLFWWDPHLHPKLGI